MLLLSIHDIDGAELNMGDWIQLHNAYGNMDFFVQVQLLADGQLSPFDNFTFDWGRKINKDDIPVTARQSSYGYILQNSEDEGGYTEVEVFNYMLNKCTLDLNRKKYYSIALSGNSRLEP